MDKKTEGDYVKDRDRANRAQNILDSDVFNEAFEAVIEGFNKALLSSNPKEHEYREVMYHAIQGARHFHTVLTKTVNNGKFAATELERIRNHKEGIFAAQASPLSAIV